MSARRTRRSLHTAPLSGDVAASDAKERANQILLGAQEDAARRGVPVSTVLRELGFNVALPSDTPPSSHGPDTPRGPRGTPPAAPVVEVAPPDLTSAAGVLAELPGILSRSNAVDAVHQLFRAAITIGATDIHLESLPDTGRARFRIDGLCADVARIKPDRFTELIARIKILADLDVTERRRPQDGHLRFRTGDKIYDMRLATVPTKGGEKIAIRIASTGHVQHNLEALGMDPRDLDTVLELSARPFGMVLATGPVGSGKTTTLYSCLNAIDRTRYNVCSIEDPVEVEILGVNQVEANYFLGFDFVAGLRALLRQDPDVILIGEVRDEETARTAVRASMTGRLVFSTLHANQATGAISTLRNFNIANHQLASSLQGVIAQRLVRRVCTNCAEPYEMTQRDHELLGPDAASIQPVHGRGCTACSGTGYRGRLGVYEVFPVDDNIRGMMQDGASERLVRETARSLGMRTLQERCIEKIGRGLTTVEEFRRVLNF
ncbi:MAG: type II secretory ATPase GspE/PulE/Tfp pilus assembly ATPase PilB-like protein [Bradymonadia bacterium]|jgi:type II secretory ATPase GspE/PulE/Tfp pilus assembly ATPase PilB-like protein